MRYQEKRRWTAKQVNFLIENWDTLRDEEIAQTIGKTLKSVRRKRERMLLRKDLGRGIVRPMSENNPHFSKKSAPPNYMTLPERNSDI